MIYEVQISELLARTITVKADSFEEAMRIAEDKYYGGDIVLSADDYVDGSVQFEIVSEI